RVKKMCDRARRAHPRRTLFENDRRGSRCTSHATEVDGLTGDESALLAEIEVDDVGHILGRSHPWNGLAFEEAFELRFRDTANEIGVDRRWADGVHGNAKCRQLAGEHLGQGIDRRLCGRVGTLSLE